MLKKISLAALLAVFMLPIAACEDDAGHDMEDAAEELGDDLEDAADQLEDETDG